MHKEQCKQVAECIADSRAKMHAMAREERAGFATPKQWHRWSLSAPCSEPLACLVHCALGDRVATHVVMVSVEFRCSSDPTGGVPPSFIVRNAKPMSDVEIVAKGLPYDSIQATRRHLNSSFGIAIFIDGRSQPCSQTYGLSAGAAALISGTTVDDWIARVNQAGSIVSSD